jgi:hypothetical protein
MRIVEEYYMIPRRIGGESPLALRRKYMPARSGSARLNHNEHSLKDAIDNKRVRWQEYRVPAPLTNSATAIEPAI